MNILIEHHWEQIQIGRPVPENMLRVGNADNVHLGLIYKDGEPIFGSVMNKNGVIEVSFAASNASNELKTAESIVEDIRVLIDVGDHNERGYCYKWIPHFDSFLRVDGLNIPIRCSQKMPIALKDGDTTVVGTFDREKNEARFAINGVIWEHSGHKLKESYDLFKTLLTRTETCSCNSQEQRKSSHMADFNNFQEMSKSKEERELEEKGTRSLQGLQMDKNLVPMKCHCGRLEMGLYFMKTHCLEQHGIKEDAVCDVCCTIFMDSASKRDHISMMTDKNAMMTDPIDENLRAWPVGEDGIKRKQRHDTYYNMTVFKSNRRDQLGRRGS